MLTLNKQIVNVTEAKTALWSVRTVDLTLCIMQRFELTFNKRRDTIDALARINTTLPFRETV